jgi:hypothetical protein
MQKTISLPKTQRQLSQQPHQSWLTRMESQQKKQEITILNKDLNDTANEETRPASRPGDGNNDIIEGTGEQPKENPDGKDRQEVKEKGQKKGLKIKHKPKENKEQDVLVEDLQRDIVARDETIKELNLKVVDLQTDIKHLLDHLDEKAAANKETL